MKTNEITPQMIEAGTDVLFSELGEAVSCEWDNLAARVYRAMRAAMPGQPTQSPDESYPFQ